MDPKSIYDHQQSSGSDWQRFDLRNIKAEWSIPMSHILHPRDSFSVSDLRFDIGNVTRFKGMAMGTIEI